MSASTQSRAMRYTSWAIFHSLYGDLGMITRKLLVAAVASIVTVAIYGGQVAAVEAEIKALSTEGKNSSVTSSRGDLVLKQLLAGNKRFVSGELQNPRRTRDDIRAAAKAQYPIAVIVACSDSRVAPELLFDMGVGDLFVVRVAANVVDGAGVTVKGSIEYAIVELHVPLIMVLGHSNCGAVKSAVMHIDQKESLPGAINGLVELVKPAVVKVRNQPGDIYANATRENVRIGVDKLTNLQPIVAKGVKDGSVKVVGGEYDLPTGKVTLLSSEQK
jgi:carbonic anhydrase